MAVSEKSLSRAAGTADRELTFTRVFDAPPELVFEAWTNPRHLPHWYGPRGFTTTIQEMNVRPGGVWRLIMRGPDGRDYHNRIVFLDVVRPERLVYKHEPREGDEQASHEVMVTFVREGGKTKVTMRMLFPSAEEREHIVTKYKAVEGGNQTLDRLAEHLPRMAAAGRELVIERYFDAPRELVFGAWTDPARLQQWWGPKHFTNPVCEVDVRPGGAIRIHMRAPDGVVYPMAGVFEEIAPPERLVFTSAALDRNGNPMFEISNTVTFAEAGGGTKLTLHAKVTMVTEQAPPHLAGMEQGWNLSLDRLDAETIERAALFTFTRVFDAPLDLVWKAFTEPERLMHWWGPKGFTMLTCTVDLRPGGVFLYSMRAPKGDVMSGKWVYRAIDPPERLVTVVSFTDEAGNPVRHPASPTWPLEVLNAMMLTRHEGKTKMTLHGFPVNATAEERATFAGARASMEEGFTGTLDQLAAYLATCVSVPAKGD
jgi:uncharacterized protein YndB with AHSA1/START domain